MGLLKAIKRQFNDFAAISIGFNVGVFLLLNIVASDVCKSMFVMYQFVAIKINKFSYTVSNFFWKSMF